MRHAEAAHIPQQRDLCLPRGLPAAAQAIPGSIGVSWSEIARRLGTYRNTVWRWAEGRARPNYQHRKALWELADGMGLGHLLTE